MKKSKFQWQLSPERQVPEEFEKITKKEKLHPMLAKLLYERGIDSSEKLRAFLHPSVDDLHSPFLMHDMEKATSRIFEAVAKEETILIYGDYDADGITSTTLMKETLEQIGAEPLIFLPNRFEDGYGPNLDVYKYYIKNEEVDLIITVDNGVAGHEALSYAKEEGIDVIVTDHHELPDELPEAFAIIHPKHPAGEYPFAELAGVGVAFKLACALLGEEVPMELLDLVAIGTIADMVSLIDENRTLVQLGLGVIREGLRIGLSELIKLTDVEPGKFTETDIGFQIGPRLNALGRLGDATPGVTLMSTFDEEEAHTIAQVIDANNLERKAIVEKMTKEAFEQISQLPKSSSYVLAKAGWHEGVLGIVAGNIMNKTGKPTIALTINEETGLAKGSARSIDAVNIYEALNAKRELFTAFGGHHSAAGMTLPVENIPALAQTVEDFIKENKIDISQGRIAKVDERLEASEITVEFIKQINILAPFGMDFPKPVFLLENVSVTQTRVIGKEKNHLKLQLDNNLNAIAFGMSDLVHEFSSQPVQSFIGKLDINEWNGTTLPQLMVEDSKVSGIQVFDVRGKNPQIPIPDEETIFLVFEEQSKNILPQNWQEQALIYKDLQALNEEITANNAQNFVLVDIPERLDILKEIAQNTPIERFYLKAQNDGSYFDGLGTRKQYGALFTFIAQNKDVDVRHKSAQIAEYLHLPKNLLIFMLQVFQELGFVEIKDGIMNAVANPEKKELTSSSIYQKRQRKMETQGFLSVENIQKIQSYMNQ